MVGFPAARLTDLHLCPMFTGIVPHVGGPITGPGAPTVLIGKLPSARILDMATCVGPPDPIAQGSSTVLVMNMPASRILDTTSHGGVIVLGCFTVFIGGAAATIKVDPNASPAYVNSLRTAMNRIFSTPSGREWLRQMGQNGQSVTFHEGAPGQNDCTPRNGTNARNGRGTSSDINWDPNTTSLNGFSPAVANCGSDVILFHEMVHALHNANGDHRNGPNESFGQGGGGTSQRGEERSTVGSGPNVQQADGTTRPVQSEGPPAGNAPAGQQTDYSRDVPTENSYRRDQGLPERPSYFPTNWPGGAPW